MTQTSFNVRAYVVALPLVLLLGCASQPLPVEPALCVPLRPVFEIPTVSDQRMMKLASPVGFAILGRNAAKYQSQIRVLEKTIRAHDEPLGGCNE